MTTKLRAPEVDVVDWDEASAPSPELQRLLDTLGRVAPAREEQPQRPSTSTARTPRPFAYD